VDAAYEFDDPISPWPFAETIELSGGMSLDKDFIGIKIGDINGTVVANAGQIQTRGARQVLMMQTQDREVRAGEIVAVPVSAENFRDILGFQFTMMTPGLEFNGIESGELNIPADYVAAHDGAITMSWANLEALAEPSSVDRGHALFILLFTATADGHLRSMLSITSGITEAEAYQNVVSANGDVHPELLDLALQFGNSVQHPALEYALYQNEPNPFADQTKIGFDLPAAMPATITVYDVHGRAVRIIEGDFTQGYNEVILKGKELRTAGAYYYRLNAGDFTASKRLILSKE
jgi:hypothetical protein